MAKEISKGSRRRAQDLPSTGDGTKAGHRVNMADTNLPARRGGGDRPVSRLRTMVEFLGGRHRKNG